MKKTKKSEKLEEIEKIDLNEFKKQVFNDLFLDLKKYFQKFVSNPLNKDFEIFKKDLYKEINFKFTNLTKSLEEKEKDFKKIAELKNEQISKLQTQLEKFAEQNIDINLKYQNLESKIIKKTKQQLLKDETFRQKIIDDFLQNI